MVQLTTDRLTAASTLLAWAGLGAIVAYGAAADFVPQCWPTLGAGVWLLFLLGKGLNNLSEPNIVQACMFFISAFSFVTLVQVIEPTFSGWTDVFFFCGRNFEFCNCDLTWNALGWYKAIVLWLFTICFAAGVRNLLAHMLFGGLLPGEEYIDHEAFQTVFVRLIPYWFNQWEQQWGVECTSLLFELPYFATELLVILPFVQIICRRLKPLLARRARMTSRITSSLDKLGIPLAVAPDDFGAGPAARCGRHSPDAGAVDRARTVHSVSDLLAIDPGHGEWMLDARQIALWPRLRANLPMVAVCGCVAAAAVGNVATMTVAVNGVVAASPRADLIHVAALDPGIASGQLQPWHHLVGAGLTDELSVSSAALALSFPDNGTSPHPDAHFAALTRQSAFLHGRTALRKTECAAHATTRPRFLNILPPVRPAATVLVSATRKNSKELAKMRHRRHQRFALALELVLVAMRLSCEGFFVLMATYGAYLLRGPPRLLAAVIRAMSALSLALQGALSIFPAVCWAYGAGLFFSTFVSLVFWGAPAWAAYEFVADNLFAVVPVGLRRAGRAVQQRAGPQCVICWGTFEADDGDRESDGGSAGPGRGDCRCDAAGAAGVDSPGTLETASVNSAEAQAWGEDAGVAVAEGQGPAGSGAASPRTPPRRRRRWFPFGRRRAPVGADDSDDEVVSRPAAWAAEGAASAAPGPDAPNTPTADWGRAGRQAGTPRAVMPEAEPGLLEDDGASGSDVMDGSGDGEDDPAVTRGLQEKDIVVTECRHVFHYGCLSHWLQQCMVGMRSTACPLCQRPIEVEIRLDALGLLRRLRQQLWQAPLRRDGGGGEGEDAADEQVVAGMVGAGAPHATFAAVDFLRGHMPPATELNTGFYQTAQFAADEPPAVPFITRWAHDVSLLHQWGYGGADDRGSAVTSG